MRYHVTNDIQSHSSEDKSSIDETIEINIDKVVRNPRKEILVKRTINDKGKILVIYSDTKRRLITFKISDGNYNKNEITLWDILHVIGIELNNQSSITAIKPCKQNILYVVQITKGYVHYQNCDEYESEKKELGQPEDKDLKERNKNKKIEKKDADKLWKVKSAGTKFKQSSINEKHKKKKNALKDAISVHTKLEQDKKNRCSVKIDEKVTKKLQKIETLGKIIKKAPVNETVLAGSSSDSSTKVAYYLSPSGTPKFTFYLTDYKSLEEGQWINDLIIDWYLTYLYEKVFSEDFRQRTYIYSSLFFAIMRNDVSNETGSFRGLDKKYSRVKRFVKDDVNIFEKDFVIMPVNEDNRHWYLMIICYPGLVKTDQISTPFSKDKDNLNQKTPRILVFDSLKTIPKNADVCKVREYLRIEYYMKFGKHCLFSENQMKCDYLSIAMQQNSSDCGIFVLQFAERFFKDPKVDYVLSQKEQRCFNSITVIKKRAQLALMLRNMHRETLGKDARVNFPELKFPTLKTIRKDPKLYFSSDESAIND